MPLLVASRGFSCLLAKALVPPETSNFRAVAEQELETTVITLQKAESGFGFVLVRTGILMAHLAV